MKMIGLFVDTQPNVGTKALMSLYGRLITAPAGLQHDYCFEAEAELLVDPTIGKKFDPWWIIATSCNDLAAYYRGMIEKRFNIRLLKPSFDSHVSVVVGEEPLINASTWNEFNGRKVKFTYTHEVFTNGYFWWIRVKSKELENVRKHFGLIDAGSFNEQGELLSNPFHLTVGKTHPSDITVIEDQLP